MFFWGEDDAICNLPCRCRLPNFEIRCFSLPSPLRPSFRGSHSFYPLSTHQPPLRQNNSEQLELLEEKLRELAALPRGDSRSDDDRAVALSQVDALRKELALVCRAGLPSVVFGKVRFLLRRWRRTRDGERKRESRAGESESESEKRNR